MTARYATAEEIQNWDTHILSNPDGGNIFSSLEFAEIKKLTAYTPLFVMIDSLAVTVLQKNTAPLGKLWYLPKGPNVTTTEALNEALAALRPLAKKAGAFVVRVETELPRDKQSSLSAVGLKKAAPIIPNPSTITLSLEQSLDDILTTLPQKGRHAIRRAGRDGVTVELVPASDENCKEMYALLAETAKGQFGIRSYDYFRGFWQSFEKAGLGQLFFAVYEGKRVAGAYAMTFGAKSTYKDGASIRERTAYGASHLLQWKVIEWAKSRGVVVHDFCGSPPSDEIDNEKHPHYGIGRFKQSFSRNVVDYIGCYDFVISPIRYALWQKIGERVHRHLYFKKTRDYYY